MGAARLVAQGEQRDGEALVIAAGGVDELALVEMGHLDAVDGALHRRLGERVEHGLEGGVPGDVERLAAQPRAQAIGRLAAHAHRPRGIGDAVGDGEGLEEARLALRGPAVVALGLRCGAEVAGMNRHPRV